MQNSDEDFDEYPISYSIDNAILMHRDAHFGGDFAIMLDYYKKEGKGVNKEFEISRIEELNEMEKTTGKNLSPLLLSGVEAEKVSHSKSLYKDLRELFEKTEAKSKIPRLIADLILADDDKEISEAIQRAIAEKGNIVQALIDLVRSEDFYDPLFPGYGQAPLRAAECLGLIGDKRAIISLFESIGTGDFFNEDMILNALHAIGEPSKAFLLKVVHGHPITMDNEQAAVALVKFKEDPEVSTACLNMLKEIDLKKYMPLATYLVLACEGLPSHLQKELLSLMERPSTPKSISLDIKEVAKSWK